MFGDSSSFLLPDDSWLKTGNMLCFFCISLPPSWSSPCKANPLSYTILAFIHCGWNRGSDPTLVVLLLSSAVSVNQCFGLFCFVFFFFCSLLWLLCTLTLKGVEISLLQMLLILWWLGIVLKYEKFKTPQSVTERTLPPLRTKPAIMLSNAWCHATSCEWTVALRTLSAYMCEQRVRTE